YRRHVPHRSQWKNSNFKNRYLVILWRFRKTVLHFLPSGVILYTEKVWTKSETDRMGHSGCKSALLGDSSARLDRGKKRRVCCCPNSSASLSSFVIVTVDL